MMNRSKRYCLSKLKVVSILICVLFCFSLISCGDEDEGPLGPDDVTADFTMSFTANMGSILTNVAKNTTVTIMNSGDTIINISDITMSQHQLLWERIQHLILLPIRPQLV